MRKLVILSAFLALVFSCSREVAPNPWDDLNNDEDSTALTGFADIHKNILEPKCANPACHDGTFEPDFRTIEGSYNTLVYHPVTKNDEDLTYEHRVVPGDIGASWMYNRITTTNDTLGQMPLYAPPLSQAEIDKVVAWINGGATDVRGEEPIAPNEVPRFDWYVAFSGDVNWNGNRIDNTRQGWEFPFEVEANDTVRFLFHMSDDMTLPVQFSNFKFFLSHSDEYTATTSFDAQFYFGDYWTVAFPPNTFTVGDTNYFYLRYSDGDNTVNSPELDSPWWYKDHCSFYIK